MTVPLRTISGWRDDNIFITERLFTAVSVEKELWMVLRSYSEIRIRGKQLLTSQYRISSRNFNITWKRFRSFIRQAENYWLVARNTNYKSSSLLYYYSFLNLVKAYLLLKNPTLEHRLNHGLSYDVDSRGGDLRRKFLSVRTGRSQVFNLYYRHVFDTAPPQQLYISHLLSYTSDVAYQYAHSSLGGRRNFPGLHRIVNNRSTYSWIVLLILRNNPLSRFRSMFTDFFNEFEKTEVSSYVGPRLRDVFGLKASELLSLDIYQTKAENMVSWISGNPPLTQILIDRIKSVLENWIEPNYYKDEFTFNLNFPRSRQASHFMSEEIAIYTTMFFMSELVRYRPDYLDKILENKAAELMENFVESCPLKFLRAITSRIAQKTIVLSNL